MPNPEKTAPIAAPDDDTVYSVMDRIMIDFGRSLEEVDGFAGLGSGLATLFRREKVPNEAEIRAILEGSDK
ncbi:hypothetical protein OIU93_19855 [Paeniglutamicibacter sp. ZC-3]|uniref:hypothetical protein n=1 Tax=Paeniglutamicibacter sp. ZC-3 TaxID=2986919 RepID=UPI0021F7A463|nr:hypothetical protein [Paeniglutamicibacter sp. ZC-3]MCV9996524.1 hypothetical protein [Paeniglutamicibacter sp. ZC-3]